MPNDNETVPQNAVDRKKPVSTNNKKETEKGIRCYGKAGFFAPEKQPDGTIVQKFYYGREGD